MAPGRARTLVRSRLVRRVRPRPRLVRSRGRDRPAADRQGRPPRAAPGRSAGDGQPDRFLAVASAVRDAFVGLDVGDPLWAADRGDELGCHRPLGRLSLRARPAARPRAGRPPDAAAFPADWDSSAAARDDVAVHLFGLKEAPTRRGQVNILWQISHPDLATPEIYERYDHVFVASDPFAAWMAGQVAVPVTPLHQATDPERFRPEPGGPASRAPVRGQLAPGPPADRRRPGGHDPRPRDLRSRTGRRDLVDQRFVKGENVPNTELARYYSAADIVLNDHWDDMRFEGLPLEPPVRRAGLWGVRHLGPGRRHRGRVRWRRARPTTRETISTQLIDRYLDDPDERQRLAAHGRAVVLARHTLDRRARVLCEVAEPLAAARRGQQDRPDRTAPVEDVAASPEVAASGTHR